MVFKDCAPAPKSFAPALFCAEKDPLECHRTILVCRCVRSSFNIQHILAMERWNRMKTPSAMSNAVKRGCRPLTFLHQPSPFLQEAYDRRAQKIAYREATEPVHKP